MSNRRPWIHVDSRLTRLDCLDVTTSRRVGSRESPVQWIKSRRPAIDHLCVISAVSEPESRRSQIILPFISWSSFCPTSLQHGCNFGHCSDDEIQANVSLRDATFRLGPVDLLKHRMCYTPSLTDPLPFVCLSHSCVLSKRQNFTPVQREHHWRSQEAAGLAPRCFSIMQRSLSYKALVVCGGTPYPVKQGFQTAFGTLTRLFPPIFLTSLRACIYNGISCPRHWTRQTQQQTAIADKPRDAFVQTQWRGWHRRRSPICCVC